MNYRPTSGTLGALIFDNRFTRELPADPDTENRPRQVMGACFSRVKPVRVAAPKLVAYSREVSELLDISENTCASSHFTQVFAGNRLLKSMDPYAMCYGGHQFGRWAGQLGDGRAINLGEIINHHSERWAIQLKGAGPTPYRRSADGLAVLRSSIREFLCSEAMFHLGVPTTRALSLILTGEKVERDMFYDGNPKLEPGAVVCRVSPSFIRFGNFEIFASRGEINILKQLVDYTIRTDFPHLGEPSPEVYSLWFQEVCQTTADLIVEWMRVGFVHGVMNTDNMSILGLTIDYGPYGWLEGYDPNWTPNTTDAIGRRYCFGNQPQIGLWNLVQLANSIYPLIGKTEPLERAIELYQRRYHERWRMMMNQKLGLNNYEHGHDEKMIKELLDILSLVETDMTIFFRKLATLDIDTENPVKNSEDDLIGPLKEAYYFPEQLSFEHKRHIGDWITKYIRRFSREDTPGNIRRQQMNAINPKFVLRNYLAQMAIDQAEKGDFSMIWELLDMLRHPYDEQPGKEKFAQKRPEWARHKPGSSMLSCSS